LLGAVSAVFAEPGLPRAEQVLAVGRGGGRGLRPRAGIDGQKAKGTWLQACCCAILVQGNNRNTTVNKNRQVKNFPSLPLLLSFLVRNYPTPEE